jgi:HAD superfamily hydrolase (TIGR01509 family)
MKAVIFDMDGVIIDSQPIADKLLFKTAEKFGVTLTEREMELLVGASLRDFWRYVKDTYSLPLSVKEYAAHYTVDDEIAAYEGLEPIVGIRQLIDDLERNGIQMGLATTASKKRMLAVLDIFELQDFFSATTSDDDVSTSKPHPEVYLTVAKKLGVDPPECIAIEDSERGVQAAKNAGIKCIQYRPIDPSQNATSADLVVASIEDLSHDRLQEI